MRQLQKAPNKLISVILSSALASSVSSRRIAAERYLQAKSMINELDEIFEQESAGNYNRAYSEYMKILKKDKSNFKIWKYYFFFLWSMIEDVEGKFSIVHDLREELESELTFGLNTFSELPEFNFIVGYAISIFPYEFGEYEELEKLGVEMLKKAHELEPKNTIYEMVWQGSKFGSVSLPYAYDNARLKAEPAIREKYNGKGLMNEYFSQVLISKN